MTAKELIESNKVKLEFNRLELIQLLRSINKDTNLLEFRKINLTVGNIQNEMQKLFNENDIVNQLIEN
jgi:hypothetical protein